MAPDSPLHIATPVNPCDGVSRLGSADLASYHEFMTFTITPVLKIDDAVGPIMAYPS
jgi:hypothetical protein